MKVSESEDDAKGEEEEEKDLSVPGQSYMKLLALTSHSALPGKASLYIML